MIDRLAERLFYGAFRAFIATCVIVGGARLVLGRWRH